MKKVILDTNMLLVPGSLGVDIGMELKRIMTTQYKVCVLQATIDELKKMAEGASKKAQNAKLGLKIAKTLSIIRKKGYTDDLLVEEAKKKNTIIATQDQDLKKRLKTAEKPHIVLRQKRYLMLIES